MLHRTRWTLQKIQQRLQLIEPYVHRQKQALPPFRYRRLESSIVPPPVEPDVADDGWPVIKPGTYWGEWRAPFVLRTTFVAPDYREGSMPALHLKLGDTGHFAHPEALAYIDGESYATIDRYHHEFLLRPDWCDGKPHTLALHGWTGLGSFFPSEMDGEMPSRLLMGDCELVQIDQVLRDFIATVRVALGVAERLDARHEPAYGPLLNALDAAFIKLDTREPLGAPFYASVPAAHDLLCEGIAKAGEPLQAHVIAAGHAHIDVAWLWTLAQTRRKAGRTFHTVIRLMEQFPDFYFTQSQPQLYEFVRQDYPELFEQIKERVIDGRWEPTGGMWVEADCNLSGAESLARQLLLGRGFFREHFGQGVASPILWLPDVFGYAWNLPQLIKQANLHYFFTIKIGWSQYNRMPYESFWWQGLDGTRVLTHFSPTPESGEAHAGTYNAEATPKDVIETYRNFQQKEQSNLMLMAYGYGDGGGGPTREMQENLCLLENFPAAPRVQREKAVTFFQRLEEEVGDELPVWKGELYLEYHRGTYTTQSRTKRANRKSEFLLHDAEFLAAYAAALDPDYLYPHEELKRAWELTCLNQFHDIIPGSSIAEVYQDALAQYEEIGTLAGTVRDEALTAIAARLGGDILAVNPTSFARSDLAFLAYGDEDLGQPVESGALLDLGTLPPYSVTPFDLADIHPAAAGPLTVTKSLLENAYLRVEFNDDGDITSIYDKLADREILPDGALGNQFQAFEDRPLNWDAWDIDIFYDDKMWLADPATEIEVVEEGPLRATLRIARRILNSEYTQYISLRHDSPRLDFNTTIDWHERHILLKVAFPVDIITSRATYDIQWGNVARPTHRNTSWDWARFETAAQKWVDVSEGNYGVSLLNDCKYGHDIQDDAPRGTRIRLSLLRSPTVPDPKADWGRHDFVYSLLPHEGHWGTRTIAEAYALNDPTLLHTPEEHRPSVHRENSSFVRMDQPHVVVETVKQAEDGEGVVVRLYESQRQRGSVTLRTNFPIAEAWRSNILEDKLEELEPGENQLQFRIKPYQIVTLRLLDGSAS